MLLVLALAALAALALALGWLGVTVVVAWRHCRKLSG